MKSDGELEREQIERRIEEIEQFMAAVRSDVRGRGDDRHLVELVRERGNLLWRLFEINTARADIDHALVEIKTTPSPAEEGGGMSALGRF